MAGFGLFLNCSVQMAGPRRGSRSRPRGRTRARFVLLMEAVADREHILSSIERFASGVMHCFASRASR